MDKIQELIGYITFWNVVKFIFFSGLIIEIVPVIKWNPITSALNWLGNKLNKEVKEEMDKINKKVDVLQTDLQDHKVESWRRDILNFADSLSLGKDKSKEQFQYIISLHDNYVKYINERGLINGQIDVAYEYIQKQYNEHLETVIF